MGTASLYTGRRSASSRPYTRAVLDLPAPLRRSIDARGEGLAILVVRLGAMGDVVRTLPAVRLVRAALPGARIRWVAWDPWTDLLRNHPDLDGAIGLERGRLRAEARSPLGWPALASSLRRIAREVRAGSPGLVLDFHGDLRSGLLGRLSGAPVRLGYAGHQQKEGNRFFTTHRVPSGDRRTPRIERNLDLVRALGLADGPLPAAGIPIPAAATERAAAIARAIAGEGPYAVLGPGASRRQAYKRPPAELFGAAARALDAESIAPIVVPGPGEVDDARRVVEAGGGRMAMAPATSILELAALLAGARLFVGGDTGPLHLACGVGCPVAGLYGPTDPLVNAPWRVPSVALSPSGRAYTGVKAIDRAAGGFAGLTPDAVEAGVRALLGRLRAA